MKTRHCRGVKAAVGVLIKDLKKMDEIGSCLVRLCGIITSDIKSAGSGFCLLTKDEILSCKLLLFQRLQIQGLKFYRTMDKQGCSVVI